MRLRTAAAATLAVTVLVAVPIGAFARPSAAPAACARTGYSYSGYASRRPVGVVAATISAIAPPRVASGHAAAWVGVGDRRSHRWLQAGLASFRGTSLRLYYELALPGVPRRYVELDRAVVVGQRFRVAVVETSPGLWHVEVDGRAVTTPVALPGTWRGIATAESWSAAAQPCNRYGYRFGDVVGAGAPTQFAAS